MGSGSEKKNGMDKEGEVLGRGGEEHVSIEGDWGSLIWQYNEKRRIGIAVSIKRGKIRLRHLSWPFNPKNTHNTTQHNTTKPKLKLNNFSKETNSAYCPQKPQLSLHKQKHPLFNSLSLQILQLILGLEKPSLRVILTS